MIFSDPTQTKKFKVIVHNAKLTKKGSLRIKASEPDREDDPGYMTFSPNEVLAIKKALGIVTKKMRKRDE